mgnify:CR=1 FL=1
MSSGPHVLTGLSSWDVGKDRHRSICRQFSRRGVGAWSASARFNGRPMWWTPLQTISGVRGSARRSVAWASLRGGTGTEATGDAADPQTAPAAAGCRLLGGAARLCLAARHCACGAGAANALLSPRGAPACPGRTAGTTAAALGAARGSSGALSTRRRGRLGAKVEAGSAWQGPPPRPQAAAAGHHGAKKDQD